VTTLPRPIPCPSLGLHIEVEGIDAFHGAMDVIQKPFPGFLGQLSAYSGSALLGNGSVLMILNLRGLL